MKKRIYISERQEGFRIHESLSDKPLTFETPFIKGCIFYLPFGGKKGGDTFIIRADDYLTISFLEDMTGHGKEGRTRLTPFIENLERIAYTASCRRFKKRNFVSEIARLDKKVGLENLLALSFIRVMSDGTICCLNEGENQLMINKGGETYNISEKISHGKIGVLQYILGEEEIIEKIIPYSDRLKSRDKVLISTDGVFDYMGNAELISKRRENVERKLESSLSLSETITKINKAAREELKSKDKELPPDDYTIIGLEIK